MEQEKNLHEGHRERMMQKFANNPSSFSEHELLEVLLYGVVPRIDTNELAHLIIRRFGSLKKVFEASVEQLCTVKGVGKKIATHLSVVGKVYQRVYVNEKPKTVYMRNLDELTSVVLKDFDGDRTEKLKIFLLNEKYAVTTSLEFEDKMFGEVSIEKSELAKIMAIHEPKFAIIAHNHPSGNTNPSKIDDETTAKVGLLCDLHGVQLIEHVIVAKGKYFSYRRENRLEQIKKEVYVKNLLIKGE